MPTDFRLEQLRHWIHQTKPMARLEPASADASFRRYFRIFDDESSWIAMDAPPDKEALTPFIEVGNKLSAVCVNTPHIYRQNLVDGFLLMDDLGDTQYLSRLNKDSANTLYQDALNALVKIQTADTADLPIYDEKMLNDELQLMPQWFLREHLDIELQACEKEALEDIFQYLIATITNQPQVFVHRDYHSRNLMVTDKNNPGVIDYQDAVLGPICYDLASILRDCYIAWPEERVSQWVNDFRLMAIDAGLLVEAISQAEFLRWFDLVGLQRHIKVLGIFARLSHRDGKASYLDDLPLTLSYVLSVAARYPETEALITIFNKYEIPQRIGTVEIA